MRAPDRDTDDFSRVTGTVIGGSSSVSAQLDDLIAAQTFLATMSTTLHAGASTTAAITAGLSGRGDVLSPGTAHTCEQQAARLKTALATAGELASTRSGQMAATVAAYQLAEWNAEGLFSAKNFLDEIVTPALVLQTRGPLAFLDPQTLPILLPPVIEGLDLVVPGSYEDAVAGIDRIYRDKIESPLPATTTMVAAPGSADAPMAARSVTESMAQVEAMYPNNAEVSHIQVQRIVDPATGQGHWVAMLPGTSQWGPGHRAVLNGSDNFIAQAGGEGEAQKAVNIALHDAMKREGVLGKHEPVMLVGHSQGGIVMTNLARSNSGLNITRIVTYGSPVGRMPVPKGVRALNIENTRDIVHEADGKATGDGDARRTRIIIDDPDSIYDAHGKKSLIAAHDPGRYRRDYEAIAARQRGDSSSAITQFEDGTKGFFTGNARTYQYDAQRPPTPIRPHEDPPNPSLRPKAMVNPSTGSYVVTSP